LGAAFSHAQAALTDALGALVAALTLPDCRFRENNKKRDKASVHALVFLQ
jgi:hypothetical protein